MNLPFSAEEFFDLFARYNSAVWPAQVGLLALGVVALVTAAPGRLHSDRVVAAVLALLWVWMAVAYHWLHFATINPVARLFALLFAAQAVLLAWEGVVSRRLEFAPARDLRTVAAAALVLYALVIYPLIGAALGHRYPATPTFGAPCPTTVFTIGLLLVAGSARYRVVVIPTIWAAIGSSAAFSLGVLEDLGLLVAGVAALVGAVASHVTHPRVGPAPTSRRARA